MLSGKYSAFPCFMLWNSSFTQILGFFATEPNHLYTAYFTVSNKTRETILDILLCGSEKTYCFNEDAFELMEMFNISKRWIRKLSSLIGKTYTKEEMHRKMDYVFSPGRYKNTKLRVLEACSIAAYHQMTNIPVVTTLLSDEAPQFKQLTSQHANCWIHDGRNYKKLRPVTLYYNLNSDESGDKYWILTTYSISLDILQLILFRMMYPLLGNAKNKPKFPY